MRDSVIRTTDHCIFNTAWNCHMTYHLISSWLGELIGPEAELDEASLYILHFDNFNNHQ